MAITEGMNPDEVRRRGVELKKAAGQLNSMASQIQSAMNGTSWNGDIARRFRGDWWPTHRRPLLNVARDLEGFGQSAINNASEQDQASGAGGGTGSSVNGERARSWNDPERTRFGFGNYMERLGKVPEGEFQILRVSDNPPKYVVIMPGIQGPLPNDGLRDLGNATEARLGGADEYAERVKLEMQRAGIPPGADVMIIGHSYGGIAAMGIASDRNFNQPGNTSNDGAYHVNITHVVAAGSGVRDWVGRPPEGTNVLLAVNRLDNVATGMEAGDARDIASFSGLGALTKLPGASRAAFAVVTGSEDQSVRHVSDGKLLYEFSHTGTVGDLGHDTKYYGLGLNIAEGAPRDWMREAEQHYFAGNPQMQSMNIRVPDSLDDGGGGGGGRGW